MPTFNILLLLLAGLLLAGGEPTHAQDSDLFDYETGGDFSYSSSARNLESLQDEQQREQQRGTSNEPPTQKTAELPALSLVTKTKQEAPISSNKTSLASISSKLASEKPTVKQAGVLSRLDEIFELVRSKDVDLKREQLLADQQLAANNKDLHGDLGLAKIKTTADLMKFVATLVVPDFLKALISHTMSSPTTESRSNGGTKDDEKLLRNSIETAIRKEIEQLVPLRGSDKLATRPLRPQTTNGHQTGREKSDEDFKAGQETGRAEAIRQRGSVQVAEK